MANKQNAKAGFAGSPGSVRVCEIRESNGLGGKAGRGRNKTATIQIIEGRMLIKQFRYLVGHPDSKRNAILKAKAYVDSVAPKCQRCPNEATRETFKGSRFWLCDDCFKDQHAAQSFIGGMAQAPND